MQNQENNAEPIKMVGVHVVNKNRDGYRRAGFVLKSGANELFDVSYEQFAQLEADPDLVVTPIAEDDPLFENVQDDKNGQISGEKMVDGTNGSKQLTKAELLATAVAEYRINPTKYQTQKGELSIKAFRAVAGDDVTLDEVKAELERTVD